MSSVVDGSSALVPISTALTALKDVSNTKVKKAITAYTLGVAAWSGYVAARAWYRNQYAYTVTIMEDEELYSDVQRWLLAELPLEEIRSVSASKRRKPSEYDPFNSIFTSPSSELFLFYEGTTEQVVMLDGHKIRVSITDGEGDGDSDKKSIIRKHKLLFICGSQDAQQAVINKFRELAAFVEESQAAPRFMMANKWGEWARRNDLEARDLNTVILPNRQKERLIQDIEQFLKLKERYLKFGIPYHRGYLFEGPPGTGKTSLAKALATHFSLDVYYIPLADMEKDVSLMTMVAAVPPGSVLLLEDIDVFNATRERNDQGEEFGITLSGLLNSLDGVSTPSGLITIMTTNRIEVLDEAIVRAGRVDRVEHIGYLDDEQLHQLVTMFLEHGEFELAPLGDRQVSPAEVAEIVKRDLDDPERAFKRLKKYLKKL